MPPLGFYKDSVCKKLCPPEAFPRFNDVWHPCLYSVRKPTDCSSSSRSSSVSFYKDSLCKKLCPLNGSISCPSWLLNGWTTWTIQLLNYMNYPISELHELSNGWTWIIQWFNPPLSFYKHSPCKKLCPLGFYKHSLCKQAMTSLSFYKDSLCKKAMPPLGFYKDSL